MICLTPSLISMKPEQVRLLDKGRLGLFAASHSPDALTVKIGAGLRLNLTRKQDFTYPFHSANTGMQ